jgi:hypothetical protein
MITLVEKCMSNDRSVGVYSNYYEEMRYLHAFLTSDFTTSDTFRPPSQVDEHGREKTPPEKGSNRSARYPRNITEYVDKDGSIYMPAEMGDISVTLPSDNEVQFRAFQERIAHTNPSTQDILRWESDAHIDEFFRFLNSYLQYIRLPPLAVPPEADVDVSNFALEIIGLLDPGHDINGIINDVYIRTLIDRMRVRITSKKHLDCALRCLSLVYTYNSDRTFTLNSSNMKK